MARGTLSTHLSIFMPMCQCKNMFTSAEPFAGFPRQASCSLPFPVVRASHFPLRAASGFSTMTSSMASSEKARVLGWAKFRSAKLRAAHPPQRSAKFAHLPHAVVMEVFVARGMMSTHLSTFMPVCHFKNTSTRAVDFAACQVDYRPPLDWNKQVHGVLQLPQKVT